MSVSTRTAEEAALEAVVSGTSSDPFSGLGRHATHVNGQLSVVIRTMQPSAEAVDLVLASGAVSPMTRRHRDGLFETTVSLEGVAPHDFDYRFRVTEPGGRVSEIDDAFKYGQVLSEYDLHLFAEGTHYRAWEKLWSHVRTIGTTTGVHFSVWAPNAQRVSAIGDFNR